MSIATSDSISLNTIKTLNDTASTASTDASSALTLAQSIDQHFWFQETGADAGAHITEITQDEWQDSGDPNYHSGGNTLITSTGMNIRDGLTDLASFTSTGATVGQTAKSHSVVDSDGMRVYGNNGTTMIADLGYQTSMDKDGVLTKNPVYTLGQRVSASTLGAYSFAQGYGVIASGADSSAQGHGVSGGQIIASGLGAHAEGEAQSNYTITASGAGAHAEGVAMYGNTVASAEGAHAEGSRTTASGFASHAEGNNTTASNSNAHAEGMETVASGTTSHAEGEGSVASGDFAHAEGNGTTADGYASHAQNEGTLAMSYYQTAIGKYNVADTTNTYAVIIGNGSHDNARSNALTVDWSGNLEADGDITDGNGNTLSAVVAEFANYLPLSGGTLTGDVTDSNGKSLSRAPQIVNFAGITAQNSRAVTVPSSSRGIITTNGASVNFMGAYVYYLNGSTVYQKAISSASNVSITTSANTITISNNATSGSLYVSFIVLSGTLPS